MPVICASSHSVITALGATVPQALRMALETLVKRGALVSVPTIAEAFEFTTRSNCLPMRIVVEWPTPYVVSSIVLEEG
jgi:hypothetical protein